VLVGCTGCVSASALLGAPDKLRLHTPAALSVNLARAFGGVSSQARRNAWGLEEGLGAATVFARLLALLVGQRVG